MPSRPGQSKILLDELLAGHDPVAVEAAIARLAIIGRPALRQVAPAARRGRRDRTSRACCGCSSASAIPGRSRAIRPLLTHAEPDVAVAAVDAMGALLDARDTAVASAALDALTATLLDTTRDDVVRLRAFEAIANAGDRRRPTTPTCSSRCARSCARDASAAVRDAVDGAPEDDASRRPTSSSGDAQLEAAANGDLPADPEHAPAGAARRMARRRRSRVLHRVIERVRAHEATVAADEAEAWRVVRAATHLALATRGSRLAVYDLRESLEALATQTPVGMLSALQQVGDASVLDAVADAWAGLDRRVVPRPVGHDLPRSRRRARSSPSGTPP